MTGHRFLAVNTVHRLLSLCRPRVHRRRLVAKTAALLFLPVFRSVPGPVIRRRCLTLLIPVLLVASSTLVPAQTALPPTPPVPPAPPPARPVADSVVKQAEDHVEGRFNTLSRAGVGGQIQDAWDDAKPAAGVFSFSLCDGCTYKVRLREHMVTVLELPEGEIIERADVGDSGSFTVTTRGPRRLAVKPMGFGVDSNLMVYGRSGTVYPVYLRAESFNSVNVPDLLVRITGHVSLASDAIAGIEGVADSSGLSASLGPLVVEPGAEAGPDAARSERETDDFVRDIPFDPDALHGWGDYTLWSGGPDGEALRPETVFRDNEFTYIRFGERWKDIELPVAYVVVDDIDELVNTRVRGSTYIIESTRALITLKSGKSYLCIRYEGNGA